MLVNLIAATANPFEVMYIAARTCYSALTPIEIKEEIKSGKLSQEKIKELVTNVLASGHESIAEHITFTFTIEGISRACSHQLVRHRLNTYSQQSQRYVKIKEDYEELLCLKARNHFQLIWEIVDKYFVVSTKDKKDNHYLPYVDSLLNYVLATQKNTKAEDARDYLLGCAKTNIVMTTNLRQLIHISKLRLCTRAQKEIRMVFTAIKKELEHGYSEELASYLGASCESLGYCPEDTKCCGRKPNLQTLLSGINYE